MGKFPLNEVTSASSCGLCHPIFVRELSAQTRRQRGEKNMAEQQEIIPQWLLEIMCCPVPDCRGDLELRADIMRLVCKKCGRRYPIRDGIPVMLIEEAELPTQSEGTQ